MFSRRLLSAAWVTAGVLVLTGCFEAPDAPHEPGALALVIGNRSNMPLPVLPKRVVDIIEDSILSKDTVYLVAVSGEPKLVRQLKIEHDCDSKKACDTEVGKQTQAIARAIEDAKAEAPEADTLGAIGIAADNLSAFTGSGPKQLVVVDSGLQTAGEMPLQDPGAMAADPKAVATALKKAGSLDSLKGVNVLFTGLGSTVKPQTPLPAGKRSTLKKLWQTVLEAGGAKVQIDTAQLVDNPPLGGLPAVTEVPVEEPKPPVPLPCIRVREDQIGFLPDEATFRDDAAAEDVLRPTAEKLKAESASATLTGTTAVPDRTGLSLRRAEAVKARLVNLGVPADSLETRGVGINFDGFVPDTDKNGNLIETKAVQNRQVIIAIDGRSC
ncbi:OmpA family protein [Cryptosporangium sp. NPDC048952]|uniref:OmpA family protein n=1 Tax=Cryptosporangium sp. NPDC048952 TaxID=3363961 RepID=UPI003712C0E8